MTVRSCLSRAHLRLAIGPSVGGTLSAPLSAPLSGTLSAIGTKFGDSDACYRIDGPFGYYLTHEGFFMVFYGGAINNGSGTFQAYDRKSRVLFHIPAEIGW